MIWIKDQIMFILQRAFLILNYTFVNGQIFLGIGNYKSRTTLFQIIQNFKIQNMF